MKKRKLFACKEGNALYEDYFQKYSRFINDDDSRKAHLARQSNGGSGYITIFEMQSNRAKASYEHHLKKCEQCNESV